MGRDADAEAVLRDGMAEYPEEPTYRHSLGLLLVRQQQPEEGLTELQAAATLQPDNARFVYVYAVALNSLGRADEAVATLTAAKERFPGDFDIHWALATILRDQGRTDEARAVALELQSVYPGIPPLQELLRSL